MAAIAPEVMIAVHRALEFVSPRIPITAAFLYGSQVTGKTHKWSDIDVAVFVKNGEINLWRERKKILEGFKDSIPQHIEWHWFSEEDFYYPEKGSFPEHIKKTGILLWEDATSPKPPKSRTKKTPLPQRILKEAERFLHMAEFLRKQNDLMACLRWCHQSVEWSLRALAIQRNQEYPPRTHDLVEMARVAHYRLTVPRKVLLKKLTPYFLDDSDIEEILDVEARTTEELRDRLLIGAEEELKRLKGLVIPKRSKGKNSVHLSLTSLAKRD